ncbi:MAG: transglutaminase-like domain-containing protein [Pirellulaceae bacterium]|jgi:transglutaminase-like putative cysteine protease|nr:transglutaminase-like domain-containing protein [Pirellulaceae bacterium]MDP7018725.1 transglutaminase-like domain-containing protein [Pirellulaceae bacterium]
MHFSNRGWIPINSCFVFVLLCTVASAQVEREYYSIRLDENLIGYSVVETGRIKRDGKELLQIKSEVALKFALLGKERRQLLQSQTVVTLNDHEPVSYRMTSKVNKVVGHVDADFTNGSATSWTYSEKRGESRTVKLPDDYIVLGSNNFAHWRRLLVAAQDRQKDGRVKLPVFVVDAGKVDSMEFQLQEAVELTVLGKARRCIPWLAEAAQLTAYADAETGALVRLDLPAQKTTIELTDESVVKLAQKAQAEELLARHFAKSNQLFDDLLKVRELTAKIDVQVIGSGVANDDGVLKTSMQSFDGRREKDRVKGTVKVVTKPYDSSNSPTFPQGSDTDEGELLTPSNFIESDDPAIVSQAKQLTKDCQTRWEALESIGGWVHKEITYTIADTPSAKLALTTRTGDCGPHSTLMVAMLRSVGIPSRLVGGLVYTPTFGGSFGQHAWVEVQMGESEWLAVDPTTGEFESLSATHIKLFEGVGGVIPTSVEVLSFAPSNRSIAMVPPKKARPLPWKLDRDYTFLYTKSGKELGRETFRIEKSTAGQPDGFTVSSNLNLRINLLTSLKSDTSLVVAANASPISFHRDMSALLQKTTIDCKFGKGSVAEEISGSKQLQRDVELPPGVFCFDNNFMGCFVLICSQLDLSANRPVTIRTFHPSSLQIIPLTLTPGKPTPIKIGEREVECYKCEVAPIKNTFWISTAGQFVKAQQGDLVIELK